MTGKVQKILEEALTLPPAERADLAASLLDSLDEGQDDAVDEAWAEEIKRRIEDVDSGRVKTIPWSEARKRFLALRNGRKHP
jgi:putative addiction module component (TIGR02574 family)